MGILDTSTDTDSGLARIVGCIGNLVITLDISNAYCCNSWVFDIRREDKEGGTIGGYLFCGHRCTCSHYSGINIGFLVLSPHKQMCIGITIPQKRFRQSQSVSPLSKLLIIVT